MIFGFLARNEYFDETLAIVAIFMAKYFVKKKLEPSTFLKKKISKKRPKKYP